jgi:hypothetical protein
MKCAVMLAFGMVVALVTGTAAQVTAPPESTSAGPAPADVLAAAHTYADGGGYKWEGSGTPEEITFNGERILPKSPVGTYCSGFTFAVAMKVGHDFGLFEGRSAAQIKRFQREWYGAVAETAEKQASQAMENLGVGGAGAGGGGGGGGFSPVLARPERAQRGLHPVDRAGRSAGGLRVSQFARGDRRHRRPHRILQRQRGPWRTGGPAADVLRAVLAIGRPACVTCDSIARRGCGGGPIGARESWIGARGLMIGACGLMIGARESTIGARESLIGACESVTGAREWMTGSRRSALGAGNGLTGGHWM